MSDPHDLLFPRLRTVPLLFLCSWVASMASGTPVALTTKADKFRGEDHSSPWKEGSLGEDFIEGAGFKLSCLYPYQRRYHDSTLRDDCCLFASSSGADGEGNCKALSGKLERGHDLSPRLQMQGAGATDSVACFSSCRSPAWSSSACTSAPTKKRALPALYTHVSRTRCGSDRGKMS